MVMYFSYELYIFLVHAWFRCLMTTVSFPHSTYRQAKQVVRMLETDDSRQAVQADQAYDRVVWQSA